MNRRRFVQAAVTALFIPRVLSASRAEPWDWEWAAEGGFFYDDRFERAARLAAERAGPRQPIPVQGDITNLWNGGLGRACRHSALSLHGVTTESFYFCLKLMVAERARIETQVTRIDRDLFLWSLKFRPFESRSLAA